LLALTPGNRSVGGLHSRIRYFVESINLLHLPTIEPPFLGFPAFCESLNYETQAVDNNVNIRKTPG